MDTLFSPLYNHHYDNNDNNSSSSGSEVLPIAEEMDINNSLSYEEHHAQKLEIARLEREKVAVTQELENLIPLCNQYRATADRYAREIDEREQVSYSTYL